MLRIIFLLLLLGCVPRGTDTPDVSPIASQPVAKSPLVRQAEVQLIDRNLFAYATPKATPSLPALSLLGVYGDGSMLYSAVLADQERIYTLSLRGNNTLANGVQLLEVDAAGVLLELQGRRFRIELSSPQ